MLVISFVEYGVKTANSVVRKTVAAMRIAAASANFRGFSFRDTSFFIYCLGGLSLKRLRDDVCCYSGKYLLAV